MHARNLKLRQSLFLLLGAGLAVTLPPAFAQQAAPAPYAPTLTFDVASVRQSPPADSWSVSGWFTQQTSTFRAINWSIENLIASAYGVDFYQISGVPSDLQRAMFIVQARGDNAADEAIAKLDKKQEHLEQQHMLQALLADRFKLKTHWETHQGDVYNLVLKNAFKLQNAKGQPPTPEELKAWGDHPIPTLYQQGDSRREFDYIAHGCQMDDLVQMLAGQFGRPVIDKTGLTGKYDFVLKTHQTRNEDRRDDDTNPLPPLETAIQDQLGIKLEPAKGPVQFLIIDHVEKPSEN